jgi:signal transduction histidine kinase
MRIEHHIIAISFVLGLVVWVLDTLVDHLVFYKGTFWGLLYPDASAHEIYIRSLILSLFVGFGIVLSRIVARLREANCAFESSNSRLDSRVKEQTAELTAAKSRLEAELAQRRKAEEELQAERNKLIGITEELETSRAKFRGLASHLQLVREEERTMVAREIHDELGEILTSLSMDLSWMTRRLSGLSDGIDPSLMKAMASMSDNVDAGMRLVREIASELRPGALDAAGLIGAIEWQAARFRERSGVECNLDLPSEGEFQFDRERSTELFRIFQEILTNVARHAKATVVSAALTIEPGEVVLDVQDNGRGIAEAEINEPKSFGILGMRERTAALGGEFHIEGTHGKGTKVDVRVPLVG